MATILFGYDVETCRPENAHVTRAFLKVAQRVHRETNTPCTLFICGMTLEHSTAAFRMLGGDPLYDLQSHMYAHSLIRSDVQWHEGRHIGDPGRGRVSLLRATSLEQVRYEVTKCRDLLRDLLGVESIGLRAPTGSYMGLLDRPEVLDILWEAGIRYISSYRLSREDFDHWKMEGITGEDIIQPFWYSQVKQERGYRLMPGESELCPTLPDILEQPLLGAVIDCTKKDIIGYDAYPQYLESVKTIIDTVKREDLVLSYVQHDWSSIKGDPEMDYTRALIGYAREQGVEITTHTAHYQRMLAEREAKREAGEAIT